MYVYCPGGIKAPTCTSWAINVYPVSKQYESPGIIYVSVFELNKCRYLNKSS